MLRLLNKRIMGRGFSTLASVNPSDIAGMNAKAVGDVLGNLAKDESTLDGAKAEDLSQSIDEFFRKSFRKLSVEDAKHCVAMLGAAEAKKIQSLDDKFWIWETVEEAIRPHADTFDMEDLMAVTMGFGVNMKGSEDLLDVLHTRTLCLGITSPFQSGENPLH